MNVSIVIPLFNKEAYVMRALRSVLAQTIQSFEVIVVDDGSTDRSVDIVTSCSDSRIRVVSQPNSGVSAARNHGAKLARAEMVAFLDADDAWKPMFLDTVLRLREKFFSAGAWSTAYEIEDASGEIKIPPFSAVPTEAEGGMLKNYFEAALAYQPVWSSAVLIPKHVLNGVGGFPAGVRIGEDIDLWCRIAMRYQIAWSPRICATYHQSSNSACKGKLYVGDVAFARYYEKSGRNVALHPQVRSSIEMLIARDRLYDYVLSNHLAGNSSVAREMLYKCPLLSRYWRRWILMFFSTHLSRSFSLAFLRFKGFYSGEAFSLPPITHVYNDRHQERL